MENEYKSVRVAVDRLRREISRGHWAHERDAPPRLMTIAEARARLQTFPSWLPDDWG